MAKKLMEMSGFKIGSCVYVKGKMNRYSEGSKVYVGTLKRWIKTGSSLYMVRLENAISVATARPVFKNTIDIYVDKMCLLPQERYAKILSITNKFKQLTIQTNQWLGRMVIAFKDQPSWRGY